MNDSIKLAVQVSGKLRAEISVAVDASEDDIKNAALGDANVQKFVGEVTPKKVIYVPGRLVSIVL